MDEHPNSVQDTDASQSSRVDEMTPAERLAHARQKLTSSKRYKQTGRTSVAVRDDVLGDISREEENQINRGDETRLDTQPVASASTSESQSIVENQALEYSEGTPQDSGLPEVASEPQVVVENKASRAQNTRRAIPAIPSGTHPHSYNPNAELRKELPILAAKILGALAQSRSAPQETTEKRKRRPRRAGSGSGSGANSTAAAPAEAGPSTRSRTKARTKGSVEYPFPRTESRFIANKDFEDLINYELTEDDFRIYHSSPSPPKADIKNIIPVPSDDPRPRLAIDNTNDSSETCANGSQEDTQNSNIGDAVQSPEKELDSVGTQSIVHSPDQMQSLTNVVADGDAGGLSVQEEVIDDVFSTNVSSTSTPQRIKDDIEYTIPMPSHTFTPPLPQEMVYLACVTRGKPLERQYAMLNVLEGEEKPGALSAFIAGFKLMFSGGALSNAVVAGTHAAVSGIQSFFGYGRSSLKRTRAEEDDGTVAVLPRPVSALDKFPETPKRKRARCDEGPSRSSALRGLTPSPAVQRLGNDSSAVMHAVPQPLSLALVAPNTTGTMQSFPIAKPRKVVDRLAGVYRDGEITSHHQQSQTLVQVSPPTSRPVRRASARTTATSPRRSPRKATKPAN